MKSLLKKTIGIYAVLSSVAALAAVDPLDTPFWQTFHISTIGVSLGDTPEYRQLMLAHTGGTMPRNVKVGMGTYDTALMTAAGGIYDYIPSVFNLQWSLDAGRENDLPIGIHLNAMPWNDSAIQSTDILHNFLEKYDGGALLQVDRFGRIRKAALAQDPTIDEESGTFPFMEMQLSLSPYAPLVQDYMLRNTRLTARYLAWLREEAPDIVTFCTMSSEIGQNAFPNWDWCDYSEWSKQEFRDWLSGAGIYAGQGQYASLTAFNVAFFGGGASGFPWASWDAVEPPVNVLWGTDSNSRWWKKWHEFRVAQVRNIEQNQIRATRSAGWSPDRIFGHQIPGDPNSIADQYTKNASPWTTTFVQEGGGGITTYGANASDTTIFNAVYADDKSWSIGEYNPKSTNITENLNALNSVWDTKAHLICPFHWTWGDVAIKDTAFLTALQQFVGNHANDTFTGMAAYEAAPDSRNVIWTMSYPGDIEATVGISGGAFTNGVYSAAITNTAAAISFQLDEARHTLASDAYYAASLRMFLGTAPSGPVELEWTDTNGVTGSVSVDVKQGWNLCHVNLAEHSAWREKRIRDLSLNLPDHAGDLQLDWVRLEAGHCWHFDDPNEVYGVENFTDWEVANGQFSGTSGADGYIYFATDKQHALEHADRAFIDANYYTKVRVRITSSANASAQLFWWKGDETPYATTFSVSAGTQTYEIDMGATPDWSGLVTRFRLDPVNADGVTCTVDFVALSPVLLPPRAPVYDMIANSPNPVFLWDPATEPDHGSLTYDFQLATDFGFTNKLLTTTAQSPTHTTYIGPELDGLQWWRVRSRDAVGNVSPWMVPLPLFMRIWNGESIDDFWGLNGFVNIVATNGIWTATSGYDSYFHLNSGNNNSGAGINADVYKQVQIRIRVDLPGGSSTAQLFFFPESGGTYFENFTVPPDGQWHERTIDLSTNSDWSGYMDRIRIDPTTASGATVSIDWVRLVPVGELAPNQSPVLPVLANQSIMAGEELILDAAATDPDVPPQTLAYDLPTAPPGASVNPTNGWFDWRPTISQSPGTNQIVLTATDSGVPTLSATQSFWVAVAMPVQPTFSSPVVSNGQFSMTIAGDSGPDYTILASTNLVDWAAIWTATPPELPFLFSDPATTNFNRRFYRVLLGP